MRRHLVRCCLAVLLTATSGGCTTGPGARLGFGRPKPTFREQGDGSPSDQSEPIVDTERPSESRSKSSSPKESPPKTSPGKIASRTPSRPPLDSATEVLIENELKDASADEQAEWLARFETMTAQEITTALAERRSGLAKDFDRRRGRMLEAPSPNGSPDRDEIELTAASRDASQGRSDRTRRSEWDDLVPSSAAQPDGLRREAAAPEVDVWGDPVPPPRQRSADKLSNDLPPGPEPQSGYGSAMQGRYEELPPPPEEERSLIQNAPAPRHQELAAVAEPPFARPEVDPAPLAAPAEAPTRTTPRIEPARPSKLSDWDPTKLFSRRKPADAPAAVEPPPQETAVPPEYHPRPAHSFGEQAATAPPATDDRRIDPRASYTTDELRRLISLMEAETQAAIPGASPELQREYLRKHVNLRLLRLVANQREAAQEPIPGLDPIDQEFWNSVFWGMANYFDDNRVSDPTERAAITAAQFQAAARHLQSTARLELKSVAFCHRIDGFGSFERYQRDEFQAGVPVLVYAELRNFGSEPTADGQYRTVLRSTVEIMRAGSQNAVAERMTFDPTEDRSRSQRTDFYNSYKINLPSNLSPGPYVLRLSVEDETTGKIATQALNFSIR